MRQLGKRAGKRGVLTVMPWLFLLGVLLVAGCLGGLCTKHLYIFRDTPEKGRPAARLALLVTDPEMANSLAGTPGRFPVGGCPWAQEQYAYTSDVYRLVILSMDGKPLYQGQCLDTLPTLVCEVAPGTHQVGTRMEIWGPGGRDDFKEEKQLTLEPGKCYFLQPDCEGFRNKQFQLKVEPLGPAYNAGTRSMVLAWQKQHAKNASLED